MKVVKQATQAPRIGADSSAQDAIEVIQAHGCVIVENAASKALIDAVEEELAPFIEQAAFGDTDITGKLTRRVGSIVARSPSARNLIMHPLVLATTAKHLAHASGFHLSLAESIYLWPGSKAQFLHQDELAFDGFDFGYYDAQVSTLWALSDYTEQMGATRIVPGSHTHGVGKEFSHADTVAAEMPRGSVMIYSGKVYHGSGENKSDKVRKALNVDYAVSWLRQEENQYLSCPPDIARTLPEDLLRLLGYRVSGGCGWIADRNDPLGAVLPAFAGKPAEHALPPSMIDTDVTLK